MIRLTKYEKLEIYEEKCPYCDGIGSKYIQPTRYSYFTCKLMKCPRCNGSGKIDWIDKIKYNEKDKN